MPTSAIPGFTGQLFASTAVATTSAPATNALAELTDVTITVNAEEINAFSKDSAGWDEVLYGKRTWSASGSANYRDVTGSTGQALLWDAIYNRTNVGLTFRAASSSGIVQYTGGGIVTRWELASPDNDKHTFAFSVKGTAAFGRAASTS